MLAGHGELSLGGAGTPALVPNTVIESEVSDVSHFFSLNTLASSVCPLVGFTFWQTVLIVSFFKRAFHREDRNTPKVPLALHGHSCIPISVTLAGGSWLGLEPPSWRGPHVPPVSLPASRAGPWGSDHPSFSSAECSSCWARGRKGLLLQLLEVPEIHRGLGAPFHSTW